MNSPTDKILLNRVEQILAKRSWQNWLLEKLLAICMANDGLRTQLFRYVDVFPVLKTDRDIAGHFFSYIRPHKQNLPWIARMALLIGEHPLAIRLTALVIRQSIRIFARHYIIDSVDPRRLEQTGARLNAQGHDITWDILGEESLTRDEANNFLNAYLRLIERLGQKPAPTGFSHNVSVKLSALIPKQQWDVVDFNGCVDAVSRQLTKLFHAGKENKVSINIDMEQYAVRDLTMEIFKRTLEYSPDIQNAGIVLQAYLRDAEKTLTDFLLWIRERRCPVTIRVVKGAYWDFETINAELQHWPNPALADKTLTDRQFELLCKQILIAQKSGVPVTLACASHNLNSIAFVMDTIKAMGIGQNQNEFQVLYGMGDAVREAIRGAGYKVRVYTPYGDLIPSMAYLVRRLLENTSQQSFLGMNFLAKTQPRTEAAMANQPIHASQRLLVPENFRPEPLTDFSKIPNRLAMANAISLAETEFDKNFPLIINGVAVSTAKSIAPENPSRTKQERVLGRISQATLEHAGFAMDAAHEAFPSWSQTPAEKRAAILIKAAARMREERFRLAALEVLEASKTWKEADADIAEAIDFLEYYARMAVYLARYGSTEKLAGEANDYGYEGRGVAVVIAPWNFPLAIATGMCAAALAAGNTVVFKPASATAMTGFQLVKILLDVGLPGGVINFLPGPGKILGEYLVKHPATVNVLFTGSRQIGFQLIKWAGDAGLEQQTHCRRVIAEMGGKNAVIIDSSADLDQAVAGVVRSAFGYQGQKCSACSRVIVLESVYDEFVRRLIGATATLKVGDPCDPATDVAAVIDQKAFQDIRHFIEIGRSEARFTYQTDVTELSGQGWFIGPTIFTNVKPDDTIAQEEIFGPVLAVIKAQTLEEALTIANGTRYKLTGGIYSRTDEHLALARKQFAVGNLYINRPITGAVVGRQPFGGFAASGTGPKAGGPDYLLQLLEAKTITENLTRRGFSPELKN